MSSYSLSGLLSRNNAATPHLARGIGPNTPPNTGYEQIAQLLVANQMAQDNLRTNNRNKASNKGQTFLLNNLLNENTSQSSTPINLLSILQQAENPTENLISNLVQPPSDTYNPLDPYSAIQALGTTTGQRQTEEGNKDPISLEKEISTDILSRNGTEDEVMERVQAETEVPGPGESFLERQQFDMLPSKEDFSNNVQRASFDGTGLDLLADLPVRTGTLSKGGKSKGSGGIFGWYEQSKDRKKPPIDTTERRKLRDMEAASADFIDVLDRSAKTIQDNPRGSQIPLTQAYRDLSAFERSIVETGRKLFGGGANFTEFEIRNILDQVGPFFGPSTLIRNMSVQERLQRLETAEDLFLNKVDKRFESAGFSRRRATVKGPDGTTIEVDAFEVPRANRLAKDPEAWAEFIEGLRSDAA